MTPVAIIGGGPAGLMLAIELGCRGVDCTVIDENLAPPRVPKANATSARTMEHYRRRGFADAVRAVGLTPDYPQDIVYCTRLATHELTRFHIPSASEAAAQSAFGDYREEAWPTPEIPHRGQQMFIEGILREQVARYPSVRTRFGQRATAIEDDGDRVRVDLRDGATGAVTAIDAAYAVGCDGPRSLVRTAMGAAYAGEGGAKRDFMGGQMFSVYFRSPDLYDVLQKPKAWMYWAVNPQRRAVLVAINGIDTFAIAIQERDEVRAADLDAQAVLFEAVGARFAYELLSVTPWRAGLSLVADRFRTGRCMLAGDAAHLFTPTGGMGYNTSVDDVVNLGWKLAAVAQGWAPDALLDTYETERRPIALRNTAFARSMAESIGGQSVTRLVEEETGAGEGERVRLGAALADHVAREFNIPGLQLGLRYESAIVAGEAHAPPPDEPNRYVPSGYAGARAPHVRYHGGSLLDHFGRDFTLVVFTQATLTLWQEAARAREIPLQIVYVDDARAHELYGADLVLIRPDHHIAWRGDERANAGAILATASGAALAAVTAQRMTA